jgi:hypothetical protein
VDIDRARLTDRMQEYFDQRVSHDEVHTSRRFFCRNVCDPCGNLWGGDFAN